MKKILIIFSVLAISGVITAKILLPKQTQKVEETQEVLVESKKDDIEVELENSETVQSSTNTETEKQIIVEESSIISEESSQKENFEPKANEQKVSSNVENKEDTEKVIEPTIEEKSNEEINNSNESNNETTEEIDEEYYSLKRGLFDTESECLSKGIEISLTDTVNIAGSYCESVSYKGKIIGYKLYIKYSSGKMEQFFKE